MSHVGRECGVLVWIGCLRLVIGSPVMVAQRRGGGFVLLLQPHDVVCARLLRDDSLCVTGLDIRQGIRR